MRMGTGKYIFRYMNMYDRAQIYVLTQLSDVNTKFIKFPTVLLEFIIVFIDTS